MELYVPEIERLKTLVREWLLHDERELEATFSGASDATTFLAVAQRLKSKGYIELQQEDKLNIITPDKVRFTLTTMAAIEDYCRTDELEGKTFEAIIKDRAGGESTVDLDEYGTRVKVRREIPLTSTDANVQELLQRWTSQKKAFRMIKRWTFMDEKKGLRFDLSMVRSSAKDSRGEFLWQTTFQQKDLTKEPIGYEIEVELIHPPMGPEVNLEEMVQKQIKNLISGMGDVLRGIQKHTFLIRRSTTMKALSGYKELVGSDRFRGVQPKPMEKRNMIKAREAKVPNIRDGYNVTDKADGLRMMGYVDGQGELFLIDMSLRVYRTGLQRLACRQSLVDGEFVSQDKDGNSILQFLIFDIYIAPEKTDVSQLPFKVEEGDDRYDNMSEWARRWTEGDGPTVVPGAGVTVKNRIGVGMKRFEFAIPGDIDIFHCCAKMLSYAKTQPYNTDGLILTPNTMPLPAKHGVRFIDQMKWKPAKDNTIDFLVLVDHDETGQEVVTTGVKPGTNETVNYKTMRLYVGSENDPAYSDPRGTVLNEQPLPGVRGKMRGQREYRPVLFNPIQVPDTMASICYAEVEIDLETNDSVVRAESGDAVQHKSIVEMTYEPENEPGWRWVPLRVRHDKTERYQRGIAGRTFNNDEGAEIVWNSIHDPITEHMITTGAEFPSPKEIESGTKHIETISKVYYDRKDKKEDMMIIRGLRDFHRLYIKENILLGRGLRGSGKVIVDLACGQGGDMNTWIREKAGFVFGTDIAGDGITNARSGAYRRYLNEVMRNDGNFDAIPKMIFTIGSSAKRVSTGEAGATPEESDIMRTVYGRMNTESTVPPFVTKYGAGRLRDGADCVALMFAIHYFFENKQTLQSIITNISDSLKVGGLFVGCCFDGETVFKQLQTIPEGGSIVGQDNEAEIWKITKRYGNNDITSGPDSLGMAIDVEFMSIGTEQREYLVPFELLKKEMANIGCDLLTNEECKQLGLQHSTSMFKESYDMALKDKSNPKFPMTSDVARYSFFNRWFIFKRRSMGQEEEAVKEAQNLIVGNNAKVQTAFEVAQKVVAGPESKPYYTKDEQAKMVQQEALNKGSTKAEVEVEEIKEGMEKVVLGAVSEKTKFELAELIQFYLDASQADKQLKMGDPDAARWLAPSSHFPIKDEDGTEYPSVEHYYYAMKFKLTSNKPDLATTILSQAGTIHQEFQRKLNSYEVLKKKITDKEEHEMVKEERKLVLDVFTPKQLKAYGVKFDEGKWATVKDKVLFEALKQRYDLDARFHRIVEKAKGLGLYMLYYTGTSSGSELGGKRKADKTIDGENKVGKMIMELAGYRV